MIYSQSFFFSVLGEDSSKSNSLALRSRAEFHSYLPFASISYKSHFVLGHGRPLCFVRSCRRSQQRHPSDRNEKYHGVLLARGGSQRTVGASANSLWQRGWRRVHSIKGGLPK